MTRCFPPLPLGTAMMGADQLDWLPCITFAVRSLLNFIFDQFVVFHCYWVWLLWYWFSGSCIYCHLCQKCVPMVVSSWANWELYFFSSSMSFVLIFCFCLWCGGLQVSSLTFSAIILSMVILYVVGESGFAGVGGIHLWVLPDGLHILLCWMWCAYWCNLI